MNQKGLIYYWKHKLDNSEYKRGDVSRTDDDNEFREQNNLSFKEERV